MDMRSIFMAGERLIPRGMKLLPLTIYQVNATVIQIAMMNEQRAHGAHRGKKHFCENLRFMFRSNSRSACLPVIIHRGIVNEWYFPQSSIDQLTIDRKNHAPIVSAAPTPTMVDISSGTSTRAHDDSVLPLNTSVSHYEVLNVCPTATTATIKDSYHALVKQYHPDKRNLCDRAADPSVSYNNSEATNTLGRDFIQIQTAWECLRDPKARLCYDNQLQSLLRQRKMRCHQRQQNSIPISIHECRQERQLIETDETCEEMEVVVDYIYQCRCGHDVYVAQSHRAETEDQTSFLMPFSSAKALDGDESVDFDDMFLHCIGCSVIYDIRPVFQNESSHAMNECASRS